MAWLNRVNPVDVRQRGTNRQAIFAGESDMRAYLGWLKEYAIKYEVEVHAWVLMTNHVHILCTPHYFSNSFKRISIRKFIFSSHRFNTICNSLISIGLVK